MPKKMIKIVPCLLVIFVATMSIFGLRYEPYNRSSTELLRPYDFFACSPLLPWFLVTFFTLLSAYVVLTRRFLGVSLAIGMLLILIFVVNWPHLVHPNVFAHNVATIEMLREGRLDPALKTQANLWPAFFFTAGFLIQITGLDVVTLNDLMLSLFALLMGIVGYCFAKRVYKITKSRIVMYAPLFMWIFLFNNRVLYEFMFHHQWYAITLFMVLVYVLLRLELTRRNLWGGCALSVSLLLIISTAITITHPITGFISFLTLLFYAMGRRSTLVAALTSVCIYVSWWTFVSYTYIGYAWYWVDILFQGGIVPEFVARSFYVEEVLPLYGVVVRNVYKVYFGIATVVSLLTFSAILFKKIDNERIAGVARVSVCAWLSVIAFAPFGIASVLWNDRVFWHIPFPLSITAITGCILYMHYFRESKVLTLLRRKLNMIMFPVVLLGLISSSFLLFEIEYYPRYYSPLSDSKLSEWSVIHSENGTRFAIGYTLRLPEYYAALHYKCIEEPAEYVAVIQHADSIHDLLYPLQAADVILYTRHLEHSLRVGIHYLGYSVDDETVNRAIDSILRMRNMIYTDGSSKVYLNNISEF